MLQKTALVFFVIGAVFFAQPATLAAEDGCFLSSVKFAEIKSVQTDFSLDYFSRIKKELNIRKNLLGETINCLIAETRALEAEIQKVRTANSEVRELYTQFSGWFPGAISYYELQKTKINDLGIEGSKGFARDLAAWREGNYKPTARLISNFVLWAHNQELIQAAKNRLSQAGMVIEALQVAPEYWGAKKVLREAEAEFITATAANLKAREALKTYDSSGMSLEAIKSSLDSLALTYKKILGAAELITAAQKK